MHIFVTGASGFIGSEVVKELVRAGHTVTGLARSDEGAAKVEAAGAAVHRGTLEDLDSLRAGAAASDGVVHTAFSHDFSRFAENGAAERAAIGALGDALAGSDRPLIVTSGVALLTPGRLATEDDGREAGHAIPRDPDTVAAAVAKRGVRVAVMRLSPSVHGPGDGHGFVPTLIRTARERGVSAYVAEGENRWPAVHRLDAARLYRLALEKAAPYAVYHAVAEEGIPMRELAESIGRRLGLPVVSKTAEEAAEHFGWFAMFAQIDARASSAKTRASLNWTPVEPGLLDDLNGDVYF